MGADLSRIRINPSRRDYAGVELKQGGVLLDADFNELVAIVDRRMRAAASDILGRSTVSSTTPDAFRIVATGGGLKIGKGRLYVDGLLAENHGASGPDATRLFDPLLAESQFADPVDYQAQPYLPDPPALPEAGRHLVYLDVWDREVTHVEDPTLVEPAVGVETSSRRQIVWQVRTFPADQGVTCGTPDDDIEGWAALIAPSTGRLSTGTFEAPSASSPCELPPVGGYTGLENQTYRVEIHDAGPPDGSATFKWSRDNGSVTFAVLRVVSDVVLDMQSLGRDDVLRLKSGDWVEVLDDVRELSQRSGEIRQIAVDEDERRITLSAALPPDMLPATVPDAEFPGARHLKVRRWDQRGNVLRVELDGTTTVFQQLAAGGPGVIEVPPAGTTLLLENGVTVSFDSVGPGGFRAGDFWVFVARTADASVERLDAAPPRGIHHHYARLAVWDVATRAVTDCRTPWPPGGGGHDCSCSQCVTPESHAQGELTIQAAVDRIRDTGGTVCLGPGEYLLREPIRIASVTGVRIVGHGRTTRLVSPEMAFEIDTALGLALEDFAVESSGKRPVIHARTADGLRLERLSVVIDETGSPTGTAVELAGIHANALIRDCVFIAPIGVAAPGTPTPNGGSAPQLLSGNLVIEHNHFQCARSAVVLPPGTTHVWATRIVGNTMINAAFGAIDALGQVLDGQLAILDNTIRTRGSAIDATGTSLRIAGNMLSCVADPDRSEGVTGIRVSRSGPLLQKSGCQILANHVTGFSADGIRCNVQVHVLLIEQNVVQVCGNGIRVTGEGNAGSVTIADNQVTDIGTILEAPAALSMGIAVGDWQTVDVRGNVVRRIAQGGKPLALRLGIGVLALGHARVIGNHVSDVGPREEFLGIAYGLLVQPTLTSEIEVADNHVSRDMDAVSVLDRSRWFGLFLDTVPATPVNPFPTLRLEANRLLVFGARRPYLVEAVVGEAAAAAVNGATAAVRGNVIRARGNEAVAQVGVADSCVFSDNRCELHPNHGITGVQISASTIIASGNRIRAGAPSLRLVPGNSKRATIVGNITSTTVTVNDGNLPAPWDALNIQGTSS